MSTRLPQSCEQLPVELELGREYYFHSIFSCPVSKDQSTRDNPPMMLPCGHVLNRESIESICKKDAVRLFKCPYCPHETRYRGALAAEMVLTPELCRACACAWPEVILSPCLQTADQSSFPASRRNNFFR